MQPGPPRAERGSRRRRWKKVALAAVLLGLSFTLLGVLSLVPVVVKKMRRRRRSALVR